jgi:hypothetical protein
MSPQDRYQGIIFPSRAGDLRKQLYESYHVFLEYWDSLCEKMRFKYEELTLSKRTTAVMIFAPQGSGKTLFADKLKQGLERAKQQKGEERDKANLWHRITGGSNLSRELIRQATQVTQIFHIEDNPNWVKELSVWFQHRSENEHCIVVADNAERAYFMQGLLELRDFEFMTLGRTPEAYRLATERFVSLARTTAHAAFFVFLTNNEEFALNFVVDSNSQHNNLISLEVLPEPSERDKETAIRVNINLLNEVTYWYCLDRAGPDGKRSVRDAIIGNKSFPDSFSAVNQALQQADRMGRPANKCTLSLAIFTDVDSSLPLSLSSFGDAIPARVFISHHLNVFSYESLWASRLDSLTARQQRMLESEWNLRIILLDNRCLSALLAESSRGRFSDVLEKLAILHGVGTQRATLEGYAMELAALAGSLPEYWDSAAIDAFWRKGQVRSHEYEAALKSIRPTYNTSDVGFLGYRPDLIINPYKVCSVISAMSDTREAINEAIRRDAHVFEFTAIRAISDDAILKYLLAKIPNYVDILERQ